MRHWKQELDTKKRVVYCCYFRLLTLFSVVQMGKIDRRCHINKETGLNGAKHKNIGIYQTYKISYYIFDGVDRMRQII